MECAQLSDEGDTCSQHAGLKRSAGIVAIVAAPFLVVAVLLAIGYVAKHAGRAEKARGESDLALAEQGKSTTTVTSDTVSVNPADTTKASESFLIGNCTTFQSFPRTPREARNARRLANNEARVQVAQVCIWLKVYSYSSVVLTHTDHAAASVVPS